ncbi:MAG: hypothetical protein KBG48_31755 [Kofleriaceae bacterium]|jgi:hypothetical protein|nr:hypothetical protein [Dermatophilaceae bacterium]MBP9172012.1 hypothetical protein [Kofleriaceae bacterium]MBP9860542.1 hypothetical protein [Kofleriaceae bacterium]
MGRTLSARPDARKSPGRSRGGPSGRDGRAAGAISPLPVDVILRGRWIEDDSDLLPRVRSLSFHCQADELLGLAGFTHVNRALPTFLARPAVARGLSIASRS